MFCMLTFHYPIAQQFHVTKTLFLLYQVLSVSFSPDGYHLATGSEDNTCRIWNLRKRKCEFVIPAHSHLISQVKFEPQEGYFLASASFDTKAMVHVII